MLSLIIASWRVTRCIRPLQRQATGTRSNGYPAARPSSAEASSAGANLSEKWGVARPKGLLTRRKL